MNYFILSQDDRISNAVEPIGIAQVIKKRIINSGKNGGIGGH